MKVLLSKVFVLIIWLTIVQRAITSKEDIEKFKLALDFKKEHCINSYKASPKADETTVKCCEQINVNHCFEKEYGILYPILLEPIIDQSCKEHLKDTLAKCDIDTSIYGYTITKYSLCRVKHQYMQKNYLSWEEENFNLGYYENFYSAKKIQLGNHTFCCFKKALYACFENEVKGGCDYARSQMKESLRGDDNICNCTIFTNDQTICVYNRDCDLTQNEVIDEKRNYVFFGITLLLMSCTNSILINYFCNKNKIKD